MSKAEKNDIKKLKKHNKKKLNKKTVFDLPPSIQLRKKNKETSRSRSNASLHRILPQASLSFFIN